MPCQTLQTRALSKRVQKGCKIVNRYLLVWSQLMGGVLSCKGSSHAVPDPADQSAVKTGAKRVQHSEQVLAGLVPADGGRVVLQGQQPCRARACRPVIVNALPVLSCLNLVYPAPLCSSHFALFHSICGVQSHFLPFGLLHDSDPDKVAELSCTQADRGKGNGERASFFLVSLWVET